MGKLKNRLPRFQLIEVVAERAVLEENDPAVESRPEQAAQVRNQGVQVDGQEEVPLAAAEDALAVEHGDLQMVPGSLLCSGKQSRSASRIFSFTNFEVY